MTHSSEPLGLLHTPVKVGSQRDSQGEVQSLHLPTCRFENWIWMELYYFLIASVFIFSSGQSVSRETPKVSAWFLCLLGNKQTFTCVEEQSFL